MIISAGPLGPPGCEATHMKSTSPQRNNPSILKSLVPQVNVNPLILQSSSPLRFDFESLMALA